jgi:hypothetical protein
MKHKKMVESLDVRIEDFNKMMSQPGMSAKTGFNKPGSIKKTGGKLTKKSYNK